MVSPFKNKFFSVAGQKERIANVGKVLNIAFNPFAKGKIEANVENKTLKKALEFGANNPYTTAGIVAGGVMGAKSVVTAGLKASAGSSGTTAIVKGLAGSMQPVTSVGKAVVTKLGYTKTTIGLVGAGVLASSKTIRSKTTDIATHLTPENLIGSGAEMGRIIEDKNLSFGQKVKGVVGTALGTTALIGATAIVGKEVYDYTQGEGFFGLGKDKPEERKSSTLPPQNPPIEQNDFVPTLPATKTITTGTATRKRPKATKVKPQNISQRVNIYYDNDVYDNKKYKKELIH